MQWGRVGESKNMNINDLKPYEKNAKKHSKKQINQVAESIKNFGFVQPIVIDKYNNIIIGHCRYEASKILGITEVKVGVGFAKKDDNFIPAIMVEDLTDEQVKLLRIADNKLNESNWEMSLVYEELAQFDAELINLTGFDPELIIEPTGDDLVEKQGNLESTHKLIITFKTSEDLDNFLEIVRETIKDNNGEFAINDKQV